MITHIRMKNFKSWEDSGTVKLAPLTGFFGTNSSGKSSLLQMLLLLKQTVGKSGILYFGNETSLVNLGNFREVIHDHNVEEALGLEFGWKIDTALTIKAHIVNNSGYYNEISATTDTVMFNASILWEGGKLVVEGNPYSVKHENTKATVFGGTYSNKVYGDSHRPGSQSSPIIQLSSEFMNLFSQVYYLGPTRVTPRRHYNWEGRHPKSPGQWGNQAIEALLSARVQELKTTHEKEKVPIEQRVSYWLQEMDLAHSFSLNWIDAQGGTTYEVRLQKSPASAAVTLVDMGYGLGQFLPVLVLCYYAPEGSTLILEQPGIHLHPKIQSQLADLLIEVVTERNLQILVESHSEHLLNRLQRRIAEEKISVDKTALYFCRNDDGVSNIERLKIDEFGNIANWPENFFGDEMGDLFAMTKAQRERQKRAEG